MFGLTRLNKDEKAFLIMALHVMQDMWSETETDLATATDDRDLEFLKDVNKNQDRAEELRKKLGDDWQPLTSFTDEDLQKLIEKENL